MLYLKMLFSEYIFLQLMLLFAVSCSVRDSFRRYF